MIAKRTTKAGDTRWFARPYNPITQEKGPGRTFDTKTQARDYIANYRLHARKRSSGTTTTVAEFAADYLDGYALRNRESSTAQLRSVIKPFLGEFRNRALSDVERAEALAFARRHPRAAQAARALFNRAIDAGLVDVNPFANLRLPQPRGRKDITIITPDQLDGLLAACEAHHGPVYGPQFAALVEFSAYVGLRKGEALALCWDRVDVANGEVVIDRSLSKQNRVTPPKNDWARTVVMPPPAADALARIVRRVDQPWVFLGPSGRRFSHFAHTYAWNPVRITAAMPGFQWHELRHFAATTLFEMGARRSLVACQLGHRDEAVTDVYLHPDERAARAEIQQLWKARRSGTSAAHGPT